MMIIIMMKQHMKVVNTVPSKWSTKGRGWSSTDEGPHRPLSSGRHPSPGGCSLRGRHRRPRGTSCPGPFLTTLTTPLTIHITACMRFASGGKRLREEPFRHWLTQPSASGVINPPPSPPTPGGVRGGRAKTDPR